MLTDSVEKECERSVSGRAIRGSVCRAVLKMLICLEKYELEGDEATF